MKSENTPSKSEISPGETISLETRFGGLSQGKCWGKYYPNQMGAKGAFEWVEKRNGNLILSGPGYYVVGSNDGFSRKAQGEFYLAAGKTVEERIEKLKSLIAEGLTKDQDELIELDGKCGTLTGSHPRSVVIAERRRLLANLEANLASA